MYLYRDSEHSMGMRERLTLALIICLSLGSFGFQGYELYKRVQAQSNLLSAPLNVEPVPAADSARPAVPIEDVASINLFGIYQEAGGPESLPKPVLENLQETNLQLILQGAFTHTDLSKASAIISSTESSTNSGDGVGGHYYFINDALPGDAVLYAVNKDSVVLKRGETFETLHFPDYDRKIIDPTPRPQSVAGRPPGPSISTSPSAPNGTIANETTPLETIAVMPAQDEQGHADKHRDMQDRLARLRAQGN